MRLAHHTLRFESIVPLFHRRVSQSLPTNRTLFTEWNTRRQFPSRAEGIQGTVHKKRKYPTDLVKPPPLRISHCPSFLFPDRSPLHDIQPDAGDGLAEHVRHMRVASEVQKLMPRRTFLRRSQIAEGLSRTQGTIGIKIDQHVVHDDRQCGFLEPTFSRECVMEEMMTCICLERDRL